jgi:hypothetical protein
MTYQHDTALLGLPQHPMPTLEEEKTAYRAAAKRTHPDAGGTAEAFQAVKDAHDRLSAFLALTPEERQAMCQPPRQVVMQPMWGQFTFVVNSSVVWGGSGGTTTTGHW